MRNFLLGILVGFVLVVIGIVVFTFTVLRAASRPPSVSNNAVIVAHLSGDIPERIAVTMPFSIPFIGGPQTGTVRDYWELFRKASADKRVRAIMLEPDGLSSGWGKLDELRSGIRKFRASGKPVYAYLRSPGARDYYVATAADRIYMAPQGALDLKGMRFEMTFYRGLLDKVGAEVIVERIGKYKDAPEEFTRTGPSEPSKEMMNSLLDGLYGQFVSVIGSARNKTPDEMRAIIDQGPFLADGARAAGLVDELKYEDQVFEAMAGRLKVSKPPRMVDTDYMKVSPESAGLAPKARVAFVAASGSIVQSSDDDLLGGGLNLISANEMRPLLRKVREDSSIKGVILRINSPGGDSFASDQIWHDVQLLAKKKPVVVSMSDMAASGGYYMAMTGGPIVAYPATFTGSIGVFYGKVNLRGLYDKLGVTKDIIARGKFADIDSMYTPLTPAGRAKLAHFVDATYQTFLERVADGRHMQVSQVDPIAQGRVWLGSQARENGLIDQLGGIDRAVELIKQKANIRKSEHVRLVSYPARKTFLEWLTGTSPSSNTRLLEWLRPISTAQWLRGSYFYMIPYTIEVN